MRGRVKCPPSPASKWKNLPNNEAHTLSTHFLSHTGFILMFFYVKPRILLPLPDLILPVPLCFKKSTLHCMPSALVREISHQYTQDLLRDSSHHVTFYLTEKPFLSQFRPKGKVHLFELGIEFLQGRRHPGAYYYIALYIWSSSSQPPEPLEFPKCRQW